MTVAAKDRPLNKVREEVIDQTRRSFQLVLDGLEVSAEQVLPGIDFGHLERTAMLLLAAEMTGGIAGVLHLIVEYLNTRKAFDRYIGSYQSLKHPSSDILLINSARAFSSIVKSISSLATAFDIALRRL